MTGEHVTVDRVLEAMPYARFLGVEPRWDGDGFTLVLPFAPHLIGNTRLPALHGGVLGALLELAALAQITLAEPRDRLPRTIDVTIEYLKPGRPETTFAAAKIRRVG
ncbi:MAG: hotdog fold thioesterase, partial [Caulobacteraceae bacterium]|nr:hotdog fold thioesterase [Caulobacteraceae bacterium]